MARLLPLLALIVALAGCSVRRMALEGVADSLSGTAGAFAADEDPELVAQALPFALKLMESVHQELPEHERLLLAMASGFTQYTYAFVQTPAERLEERDFRAAQAEARRAARLYLRAHRYGLQALALRHPGLTLERAPAAALAVATAEDVPLLYWSGAALAAAIALSKGQPEMIGRLALVEALMQRALALDEAFGEGALHEFFISYRGAGEEARAREHFQRALALSRGLRASVYVSLAEAVAVGKQDRAEFEALLGQALAVDVEAAPASRLANVLAQRKARRLLERVDDLFVE